MNRSHIAEVKLLSVAVEEYMLPEDGGWLGVDDVPRDLRQVVELAMMARSEGDYMDDVFLAQVSIDDVYDIYDSWSNNQKVLVMREDNRVAAMLSYYYDAAGVPFFESVAVNPELQGKGIGAELIDAALDKVARESNAESAITMAQERVAGLYERKWGAQRLAGSDSKTSLVRMLIPIPRR